MNEDLRTFDVVIAPHLADALTLSRWLTKNRADAEDVVQEACLRAFRSLSSLHGNNARGWFLTIVRNTAFSWLEKNKQPTVSIDDSAHPNAVLDIPDHHGETPETLLLLQSDKTRLYAALENLPLEFREALILREIQELEYREIAQITAVPIGTVMSRLSRARRQLASLLARGIETS